MHSSLQIKNIDIEVHRRRAVEVLRVMEIPSTAGFDVSSGAFPVSALSAGRGVAYIVTIAGDVAGTYYGVGDVLVSDGAAWLRISGQLAWGVIQGSITDQADLATALGAKQDAATAFSGEWADLTNVPDDFPTRWGNVGGAIADQLDLQALVAAREASLGTPGADNWILGSDTGGNRVWLDPATLTVGGSLSSVSFLNSALTTTHTLQANAEVVVVDTGTTSTTVIVPSGRAQDGATFDVIDVSGSAGDNPILITFDDQPLYGVVGDDFEIDIHCGSAKFLFTGTTVAGWIQQQN